MTTRVSPWWLYGFVIAQIVFQTVLLIPGLGPGRTVLRAATFASSILFLLVVPGRGRAYPLAPLIAVIIGIVTLELLHPGLNTPLAGVAQVALYVAIWGPVFWVVRVAVTPLVLANVLMLLWAFHATSAAAGVLQVYSPERFAPEPEFVKQLLGESAEGLMVQLHDGTQVFRPFGLTDSPGGAAVSGAFAVLIGSLLIGARGRIIPVLGTASVAVGLFCIYLSHIRSLLVVTVVSVVGLVAVLVVRGQVSRAVGIVALTGLAAVGGFLWASAMGTGVAARFETLLQERPLTVYYANRGVFLEETFDVYVFRYPAGAGLGRYGMTNLYFGTASNPDSPPLWAEIQSTAWVFDGGVLLLLAGYAAVIGATGLATVLALRVRDRSLAVIAAAIAGFDLSILVNTFGYSNFLSQGGMMFWVLNAALYTACTQPDRQP